MTVRCVSERVRTRSRMRVRDTDKTCEMIPSVLLNFFFDNVSCEFDANGHVLLISGIYL